MTDAHLKGLEDEVAELKKKNQNIQKELKEVKNLYEDADFELKNAQRKLEEEKRTKNRLEEEQRELEKERDALKRKLDAERKKQGVGASDELQDRLNELEEKLQEQKESRKEEKKKFEDTRAKMHKEVIELVESKRVLKDDLEAIKGKLENQKKDYEKRISELKARQEEYEQNQQKMAEERQRASQQGSSAALVNQKTEEELRALRSKLDNKHKKNKDLKEEKEQLEEELDSMKKKYKRQTMAMQEFDEAKEKFEKSLAELRTKLKEETSHNSELSEQTENLTRDNDALKQKLDKLEKEKAKLKDEKDKRKQNDRDAEKEVDVLKDKLQEKEVELTKLSELKRSIEKELESLKGQKARSGTVDSSSVAALEAKIAELKNLLDQEKAKNASLNESISLKTQELAAKNKEIDALKEKLAETKQKKKDVKAKLGAEVRQLKMQVTELETVAAASDEKSRKLQSELDSKMFVAVKHDNSRELADELERVKKQLLTKKNKKKALKKSYDNLDEKYKALQAQAEENERLRKEVERLEKMMGELEEHSKHEIQVTKKRVQDLEAQNKVMSTAAIEARQYVEQAQKDTDSLVNQLQEKLKESLEREHQYKQLQAESGNANVQLSEAEAQINTLRKKYNEIKVELERGHAENAKLQAANHKLAEENKQLVADIAKYKKYSELEAREFGLSAGLDGIMRRRILPEYVAKHEEEAAQAHKAATILQVKLEKILERETETRKIKRSQESKVKRNIHWLRTERRRIKNNRNKLAETSNTLAECWEKQNRIENELFLGKRKFQHHLDGSEPLPEATLINVLQGLKTRLNEHSEIERSTVSAKEKRDVALLDLKNSIFTVERAIAADDYGLADPEEATLKKELEQERAIRRRYEEKHDQAVIKAREAGSRLVEVITTYSDQLFPSAPDAADLPQIVTRTIDFLEQKAMAVENIFGKTEYQVEKVKQIKKYFDEGYDVDLSKCGDFKIVGELLKAYFRELPDSLIPIEISDKFTTVLKETPDKVNKIEELIESLPKSNRKVLAALAIFLNKLSKKSDINKMTGAVLGEIFGPYLLRPVRAGSNLKTV